MAPVGIDQKNGDILIVHRCEKCGFERRNKTAENDDVTTLAALSESLAKNQDF